PDRTLAAHRRRDRRDPEEPRRRAGARASARGPRRPRPALREAAPLLTRRRARSGRSRPTRRAPMGSGVAALSLVGFGAFVLASSIAGVRLLRLATRTRQASEAVLGAALLLGGGLGYLLMVLALDVLPRALAPATLIAANLSLHAGALLLALGTAHIFRPGDARARAGVAAIAVVLAVSDLLRMRDPGAIPARDAVFWTATLGSAAAYGWSALEAGRYALLLRRRL